MFYMLFYVLFLLSFSTSCIASTALKRMYNFEDVSNAAIMQVNMLLFQPVFLAFLL